MYLLLKSRGNYLVTKMKLLCLLSIFALSSVEVFAEADFNRDFNLHGFISQGVIDVNGSNFVTDDGGISAKLTEVGLNASYQLNDDWRLAGQVVYLNGGNRYDDGARVDYALIDWSLLNTEYWQVNLYMGRYKNYHWLYSSTRDVPFTRPSIILPQSIYFDGFRDLVVGGDGVALKVSHSSEQFGDFDFHLNRGTTNISREQTQIILGEGTTGDMDQDHDMQASLYWRPLLSQWRFGLALGDTDIHYEAGDNDPFLDADITLQRVMLNALYEGEYWEFSSEIFQERFVFDNFHFEGFHIDTKGQGYFFQSRYKVTDKANFLLRYERFYGNKDDRDGSDFEAGTGIPSYFAFQHDTTIGLSYDLAKNVRVQLEHHWVEGAARLTPVVLPNPVANDSKYWNMWAVQLMYWF